MQLRLSPRQTKGPRRRGGAGVFPFRHEPPRAATVARSAMRAAKGVGAASFRSLTRPARAEFPVPLDGPKSRPASPVHALFGPAGCLWVPPTGFARSTASLHAVLRLGAYDRVRVAAKSKSTAAGSRRSVTTRMKYLSKSSSPAPSSVARYRTGPRSA